MGIIRTIIVGDPSLSESQEKKRKLFMYLVSGGLTTVTNLVCYALFDILIRTDMLVSIIGFEFSLKVAVKQVVSWIAAVLVAYFLNRLTVFRSKGNICRELISFIGARILSFFILELGLLYFMLWICELISGVHYKTPITYIALFRWTLPFTYEYMIKLINSVFVVVANYVLSKHMVFRKIY